MITINAPDGSTVNFPDGTSEGTINQVMTEKFAPKAENSLAGSAKALGVGVGEGAIALAGLPGDVVDLASRGFDYATGKNTNESIGPAAKKFGSENIKKLVEGYTGEFRKPQTTAEEYLQTIGSFAPAALAGPGGIGRRVLTQVVAPGVASETAGQLAEGSGYEPVARIAGALGGAMGASKLASSAAASKSVAPVPLRAEIASDTKAGYTSQAVKDLEIAPSYAEKVADSITANLKRNRFSEKDPATAAVYGIVSDLKRPEFATGAPATGVVGPTRGFHTMADFDNTRRRLNEIAGGQGSGAEAARKAIRTIDAATLRVPQSAVIAGDARAASKSLFDGRKSAAVGFRDDAITAIKEKAANTAAATHSGGNFENEVYKQVRTMLNNPKKYLRGWSAEEKEVLRAVLPDYKSSALRRTAKVMGGGGGLGQLAAGSAGAAMFGPLGMFALPALGLGANKLGSALASSRLNKVSEQIRARAPRYGSTNQATRQAALAGGILKGLPEKEQLALQAYLASLQPQLPAQQRY